MPRGPLTGETRLYLHAAHVQCAIDSPDRPTASFGTQYGWTPLHGAAESGHAAVVELLLNHGASGDLVPEVRAPFLFVFCNP